MQRDSIGNKNTHMHTQTQSDKVISPNLFLWASIFVAVWNTNNNSTSEEIWDDLELYFHKLSA